MTRLRANLLLVATAIIWGTTFVVQQAWLGTLGPIAFTAARFLLGALVILPLALRQLRSVSRTIRPLQWNDWLLLLVTGCVLFTAALLQQVGILHTQVTNAGFLTALYVPLVPLIGLVLLQHQVHWSTWPAALASLGGTYLLSGTDALILGTGDLWVIASALFWAIHVLLVAYLAVRTHAPLVVAAAQFLTCGLLGLLASLLFEGPTPADFASAFHGILYAGILSVGIGFTLQVVGQRFTHPADAAIILNSETLFAAIAGFLFLGERLLQQQLIGAGLILAGTLGVQLVPLLFPPSPSPLSLSEPPRAIRAASSASQNSCRK